MREAMRSGKKRLEILQLLADADKFDRLARHRLQTERRAAPRVAVQLGQDRPGDLQRLVEMRGHIDRLLPRGRVKNKEDFLRFDQVAQPHQFLHQRLVDLQPAGGVENQRVAIILPGEVKGFAGDFQAHPFPLCVTKTGKPSCLASVSNWSMAAGPVNVHRDQQRRAGLFVEQAGQFGAGSRFAGAVQTDHHDGTGIAA